MALSFAVGELLAAPPPDVSAFTGHGCTKATSCTGFTAVEQWCSSRAVGDVKLPAGTNPTGTVAIGPAGLDLLELAFDCLFGVGVGGLAALAFTGRLAAVLR